MHGSKLAIELLPTELLEGMLETPEKKRLWEGVLAEVEMEVIRRLAKLRFAIDSSQSAILVQSSQRPATRIIR
jgi:hypothetical protein